MKGLPRVNTLTWASHKCFPTPNPPSLSAGVARKEIDHGNPWTLPLVTIRFRSGAIVALLNVNQKNCSHWQGRPDVPLWYENALGHLPYFPAFLRISRQWSTDFMAMRVYAMAPWCKWEKQCTLWNTSSILAGVTNKQAWGKESGSHFWVPLDHALWTVSSRLSAVLPSRRSRKKKNLNKGEKLSLAHRLFLRGQSTPRVSRPVDRDCRITPVPTTDRREKIKGSL